MPSTFAPHMCDGNRDVVYYRSFALAQPFHLACVDSYATGSGNLFVILIYHALFWLDGAAVVGESASGSMAIMGNRRGCICVVVGDDISSYPKTFRSKWLYIYNRCGCCYRCGYSANGVVKNALKFAGFKKKV